MQDNNHIVRLFAASQRTLSSQYLDPSSIKIDDRSTQELLSFMAELSKQFWYYNENGHRDGDWSSFFQTDLTSLLALISESYDENDYRIVLDFINSIEKVASRKNHKQSKDLSVTLWELFHQAFKPIFKINDWYKTFTRLHVDTDFHTYLKELIWRKLSFGLRDLYAFYYFSVQAGLLDDKEKVDNEFKKFQDLDVLWNFNPFPNIAKSKVEMFDFENHERFLNGLREAVKNLHNHEKAISREAKIAFSKSLNTKNTEPHIALILGFLKAYSFQQEAINQILPRHLNFYYKDALQFEKRGAIGDDVFLLMKLGKGENAIMVPKSTPLMGGTDTSGKPILFETANNLQVTPSVIADYRTLILDQSKHSKEVFKTFSLKGFDQPVISKETGVYESFNMFGDASTGNATAVDSKIGFAVSSPELFLEGGKRGVEIKFLNDGSKSDDFCQKPKILLDDLVELKITGSKGWIAPDYEEVKVVNGSLRIRFGLKKSSAAIVNYNEKLHGKGYSASWPIVVLTLKNQADSNGLNPYAVFSKLSFTSYQIKTTTKELSILSLITGTGKAASTGVAAPFGGNPTPGSQLIIGCYEAFIKHTKLLKVNVNWLNLPKFWKYYFAYNEYQIEHISLPTFFKKSFTCVLSWLNFDLGRWETAEEDVRLFSGNDQGLSFSSACGGPPCSSSKPISSSKELTKKQATKSPLTEVNYAFNIPVKPDYTLKYPLAYSDKSRSGFVSLELSGPEETFGHNLYPKIVSEVTLQNTITAAKKATGKTVKVEIVKAPHSKVASVQTVDKMVQDSTSANARVKRTESGLKKWLGKILGGIVKFFQKNLGPILKKMKVVLGWIDEKILKKLSPIWSWISKIFQTILKRFKKKEKEVLAFKPMPNKPYVPKIKGVTIDYCSCLKIVPGSDSENKLFRIHPFGIEEMDAKEKYLLPQYQKDGYALLGFSQLDKGATLSIFLAVEDLKKTVITGSDESISVEVLGNQKWEKVRLLSDTTLGLKKAGILRVFIVKQPDSSNPIMPLKSYWLRISASAKSVETCKLRMIGTNAVSAGRIIDSGNSNNALTNLKAGAITKFAEPIPPVTKVVQPFPSFGGENPENDEVFNHRVARRLFNKDRGVSITYLESIVLDSFQQIYQVNVHQAKPKSKAAPNVRIAILPKALTGGQLDPYHPIASVNLLNEVKLQLQDKVSPHVRLEVEHMRFDKIHVSLEAVFSDSTSGRSYKEELNADLKDYLSPWIEDNELAYSHQALYVNDLLQFIGSRSYITSYENLKIKIGKKRVYGTFHIDGVTREYNEHQLLPTSPLSVLASAEKHHIEDVTANVTENFQQPEFEEVAI
ncbi:MAG: hypothetical protein ABJG47_00800 [Ekhidna sp.]